MKGDFAQLVSANISDVKEVNWGLDVFYKTEDASGAMVNGLRLQIVKGSGAQAKFDEINNYYKTNHLNDVICNGQLSNQTNCPTGSPVYFKLNGLGDNAYFGLCQVFLLKGDTFALLSFDGRTTDQFAAMVSGRRI